jgi:hypothetical protein
MGYQSLTYSLHKLNSSNGILHIDTHRTFRVPVSWIYTVMYKYKYKNIIYFHLTLQVSANVQIVTSPLIIQYLLYYVKTFILQHYCRLKCFTIITILCSMAKY